MIRLSVLDQSTVVSGRMPDTSIRESLELARHCEALGYAPLLVSPSTTTPTARPAPRPRS